MKYVVIIVGQIVRQVGHLDSEMSNFYKRGAALMNNRLYTIREVANILGISTKTLRRWDQRGRFVPGRSAGNQRRYTYQQLQEFKLQNSKFKRAHIPTEAFGAEAEPVFVEEIKKEVKVARSLPSILSNLPSGSFLKKHFLLRHEEELAESSKPQEREVIPVAKKGIGSAFTFGFALATLTLIIAFTGSFLISKYNLMPDLAQKKEQFAEFIAGLSDINLSLNRNPEEKTQLSFEPQSEQAVLAAAAGTSDLVLNINVPSLFSQSVGIGTTTVDSSAILDLTAEDKGFLAPRMTTVQRDAISAPAAGLFVYNTDTNHYNMYNGTAWQGVFTSIGDSILGEAFTKDGKEGNSLYFHGTGGGVGQLTGGAISGTQTYTLPGATGTIITTGNLTDINKVGTIGSGVWNGTTLTVGYGGTGVGTLTGIVLGNGSAVMTGLTTSLGIAGAISDEVGTGYMVFNTDPIFEGDILPTTTLTSDIGSSSLYFKDVYAANYYGGSTGTAGYWQRNSNSIAPTNVTDSINLGATATASALVHLAGTAGENSWINTGNVGIGTTNPLQKLHIDGGNSTVMALEYDDSTTGYGSMIFKDAANYKWEMGVNSDTYTTDLSGPNTFWIYQQRDSNDTAVNKFRFLINDSGNVGIGATAPLATLDVRGLSGTTPVASLSGSTSFASFIIDNNGIGDLFTASQSGATKFVFDKLGYLGIGTGEPVSPVDIQHPASITGVDAFTVNVNDSKTGGVEASAIYSRIATADTVDYNMYISGGINMISGYLGLNQTHPSNQLDVTGNAMISTRGSDKTTNGDFSTHTPSSCNGWTLNSGWTCDTTNNEVDHTAGQTGTLEQDVSAVIGEAYAVTILAPNRTAGSITFTLGGASGTAISTYRSTQVVIASSTGNLIITPSSTFDGSITRVYVEKLTGGNLYAMGNIGIGTASAQKALHVYGSGADIRVEDSLHGSVGLQIKDPSQQWTVGVLGAASDQFHITDDTLTQTRLVIDTSGNVGIGITAPTLGKFTVYSDRAATNGEYNNIDNEYYISGSVTPTNRANYSGIFVDETAANTFSKLEGVAGDVYLGLTTAGGQADSQSIITLANGVNGAVVNYTSNAAGRIDTAQGLYSTVNNTGSGIIRTGTGLRIDRVDATGTDVGQTHNAYGIYIDDDITSSGGTTNNAYAIYSAATEASYFAGNIGIKTTTPTTFDLEVAGNIGPSVGSTYDLGSSARRWNNIYGVNANFTNIETSQATISGTTTQDFLINSDNVSADAEDASLSFDRGTGNTDVQLKWNSTTKQLSVNSPSFAILPDTTIAYSGKAALTVDQWQSQDIFTASASGIAKFVINNAGSVGIGTTTPSYNLHIKNTADAAIYLEADSDDITETDNPFIKFSQDSTGIQSIIGQTGNVNIDPEGNAYTGTKDNATLIGTLATGGVWGHLQFGTNKNVRMTIDPNGYVGIGNTTPLTALDVTGSASLSANISLRGAGTAHTFNILDNGTLNFQRSPGGDAGLAANSALFIQNNGYVGLGTTVPGSLLTLANNGWISGISTSSGVTNMFKLNTADQIQVGAALNIDGGIIFPTDGGYVTAMDMPFSGTGTNAYIFGIGASNVMSIYGESISGAAANLRVGIGTTAPLATLDVRALSGTTPVASVSGVTSFAAMIVDNSGIGDLFTASKSGATKFVIDNAGRVGIGTTPDANSSLTIASQLGVGGTIWFNGNGTLTLGDGGNDEILLQSGTGDAIRFNVNAGTEAMRITSGGFLGIGNTTPLTALDVTGSASLSANISLRGAATAHTFNVLDNGTLNFQRSPGGDAGLATALFIQNNGNIGIGTTAPSYPLHIVGESNKTNLFFVESNFAAGGTTFALKNSQATGDVAFDFYSGTSLIGNMGYIASDGTPRFFIMENNPNNLNLTLVDGSLAGQHGYVGIGTTNPLATLDVRSNSGAIAIASVSGTTTFASLLTDNNGIGDLFTASKSGDTKFVIDNRGNVGIGYSSVEAAYKLKIRGDVRLTNSPVGASLYIEGSQIADLYDGILHLRSGGSVVAFDGSDNVGIGTTTPLTALDVVGSGSISANLSFSGASTAHTFNVLDNGTLNFQRSPGGDAGLATALFIQNNGYVGIGTTAPSFLLHVKGNSATGLAILENSNASGWSSMDFYDSSGTKVGYLGYGNASAATYANKMYLGSVNKDIILDPGTGNVGIGNTTPLTALDVTGSASLSANISLRGAATAHTFDILQNGTLNIRRSPGGDAGLATALFIQNNGYIGIGTTVPGALLTLANNSWIGGISTASGTTNMFKLNTADQIQVGAPLNIDGQITFPTDGGNLVLADLPLGSSAQATKNSYTFKVGSDNILTIYGENSATAGRVQNARVGIGITAPLATLEVRALSGTTPVASVSGATSFATMLVDNNGIGDLFTASKSGATKFVINNAGRVGIGTAMPGTAIGGQTPILDVTGYTGLNGLRLSGGDTTNTIYSENKITISTGGSAKDIIIQPSGNVGIGNTTPLTALDVTGSASLSANISLRGAATAHTFDILQNGTLNIRRSPGGDAGLATALFIQNNGYVGIGTTAPSERLEVSNAIKTTGSSASFTGGLPGTLVDYDGTYSRIGNVNGAAGSSKPLVFLIGGLEKMRLDTSGNVGIGITAPAPSSDNSSLHVLSNILLGTANGADSYIVGDMSLDLMAEGDLRLVADSNDDSGAVTNDIIFGAGSSSTTFGDTVANYGTLPRLEFMRILGATGYIGIGTATPDKTLDILAGGGNTQLRLTATDNSKYTDFTTNQIGNLTIAPSGGNATISGTLALTGAVVSSLNMNNNSITSVNTITIPDPGAGEGIGWTDTGSSWYIDASPLDRSNTDGNLNLYGVAGSLKNNSIAFWRPTMWIFDSGKVATASALTTGLDFTTSLGGNITFNPGGTGNVGIGTTAPTAKLFIQSTAANATHLLVNNNNASTGSDSVWFRDTDTSAHRIFRVTGDYDVDAGGPYEFVIDQSGKVGIGTTAPLARLDVRGLSGILPAASVSAQSSFAAMIVDNNGIGDLFTASKSGAPKFVITNGGNVGIGITAPTDLLDVSGASRNIVIGNSAETEAGLVMTDTDDPSNQYGKILFNSSTNYMNFYVNSTTPTMSFANSGGKVGIGNTTPLTALDVTGSASISANLSLRGAATAHTFDILQNGTLNIRRSPGGDAGLATALFIQNNGNIGIGTTAPEVKLDVASGNIMLDNNAVLMWERSNGDNINIMKLDDATSNVVQFSSGGGGFNFSQENFGTSLMTIQNGGNVGIGNTTPLTALDVTGSASISANLSLRGAATAHTFNILDNGTLNIQRSAGGDAGLATALFIQNNGRVGIGTTDPGAYVFDVHGNIHGDNVQVDAVYGDGATTLQIGDSNDQISLGAATSTLYVASAGTVGIGTTAPLARLDVRGLSGITPAASVSAQSSFAAMIVDNNGIGDLFTASKSGAPKFVIANNGYVGIGNMNPLTALDVTGSASISANLSLRGAATAHTLDILQNGTLNIRRSPGGDAGLATALFIQSNGYVGLGTTAPGALLTLANNSWIGGISTASGTTNMFKLNAADQIQVGAPLNIDGAFNLPTDGGYVTAMDMPFTTTGTNEYVFKMGTSNLLSLYGESSSTGVASNLRVGIGTTAPLYRLDVQDSQDATAAAQIYNTSTNASADGLIIKLGFTGGGTATNFFTTYLNGNGLIQGMVKSNAASGVTYQTNGVADFAEYFKKDKDQIVPFGSVVCLKDNGLAAPCNDGSSESNKIIGVASQHPSFVGGEDLGDRSVPVGLVGQVRTRVSTANGAIKIGDPLTTSAVSGVAVKATSVGQILGKAVEAYDGQGEGTILVSVNISWYNPSVYVSYDGTLAGMAATVESIGDQVALQGELLQQQIASASAQTPYTLVNDPLFQDAQDKIADLQSKLDILTQKVEMTASVSAFLMEIQSQAVLGASTSATLDVSLGDIEINNATVSNDLMVLGRATVTDLGVTGNINAGLLAINGLDSEINTLSGDLKLQSNGLGGIDILSGKVMIDTKGNLTVTGTIAADKVEAKTYSVLGDQSIGSGTIPTGSTFIEISTPVASTSSKIFLTATTLTDKQITVTEKTDGKFKVAIPTPATTSISFDWWIVENN